MQIIIRRATDLKKTDVRGLTDAYVIGRFFDVKTEKVVYAYNLSGKMTNPQQPPQLYIRPTCIDFALDICFSKET